MARTEILIKWDDAEIDVWRNALKEDCVSITNGELTIKLLAVPEGVKDALLGSE